MDYAPHIARLATPIGTVEIRGDGKWIDGIAILPQILPACAAPEGSPAEVARRQIGEWFAGARRDFDLPLRPAATARGAVLRQAIAAVPYGDTRTYGALARAIASSSRAMGQACRRNPFPLVIPCHRVTSAGGEEHYSGGNGIETKAWLLAFENKMLNMKDII